MKMRRKDKGRQYGGKEKGEEKERVGVKAGLNEDNRRKRGGGGGRGREEKKERNMQCGVQL